MSRQASKLLRKLVIALPLLALALWYLPWITALFLTTGFVDVMRNDTHDLSMFSGYFLGNGLFTWLLSPFNVLVDLISNRNPGVWTLDDFPADYRAEIEGVLAVFARRKTEILEEIDTAFPSGRRGMYVYQWYGKQHIDTVPEFNKRYRYIRTIAVSVFDGRESTSLHFGPLRLTLRVLFNLKPSVTDDVFIECGKVRNLWYRNPLFIFDDTLRHRSVNLYDARRYCVFMDIIRPSPVPGVLSAALRVVSTGVDRFNAIFFKNWKMIAKAAKRPVPVAGQDA
jgi:beta-hydroxylase